MKMSIPLRKIAKNWSEFLGLVIPAIIGSFICHEYYFFAYLYIPVVAWLVNSARRSLGSNFFWIVLYVLVGYSFAMLPFLSAAIRQFAEVSMAVALPLSLAIILFNIWAYVVPVMSLIRPLKCIPHWVGMIIYPLLGAFWPNLANLGLGEVAAQYKLTQPLVRLAGVHLSAFVISMILIIAADHLIQKKFFRAFRVFGLVALGLWAINLSDHALHLTRPNPQSTRIKLVQAQNHSSSIEPGEIAPKSLGEVTTRLFERLEADLQVHPADLIALPEGGVGSDLVFAWDENFGSRLSKEGYQRIAEFLIKNKVSLISETATLALNHAADPLTNYIPTAMLYSEYGGHLIDFSYKSSLVPFIEYAPGAKTFPILKRIFSWTWTEPSDLGAHSFNLNGLIFRSLICYDGLFGAAYDSALSDGAQFIVNHTNNYYLSTGAHFQYAIVRSRVVEYGLPLLYVGNYADTGTIDSNGQTRDRLEPGQFGVVDVQVSSLERIETIYSRWLSSLDLAVSPWIGLVCLVLVLLIVVAVLRDLWIYKRDLLIKTVTGVLVPVILTISIYFSFTTFVAQVVYIPTSSMWPTIEPGSRRIVCRSIANLRRGDILSVVHAGRGSHDVIKRLLLLPGDQLLKNGLIKTADGQQLQIQESQDGDLCWESIGALKWRIACDGQSSLADYQLDQLGLDEYFVVGDNRKFSADSRLLGPVTADRIHGRLCLLGLFSE